METVISQTKFHRVVPFTIAVALLTVSVSRADEVKNKQAATVEHVVTEAELQVRLMRFADRYAGFVAQAIDDVERLQSTREARREFNAPLVYSTASAYTIAADARPQVGLLDMVVMTTLGRMVFEEHWRPKFGASADPVVMALRKLERDIWNMAGGILTAEQQTELRESIVKFREEHPELTNFSQTAFNDLPSTGKSSTLRRRNGGGMFKSVRRMTEQVEQTRMLAERGMYLSTRLPVMSGFLADVWLSQIAANPDVRVLLNDAHNFADASERLALAAEQLPVQLAEERNETIRQLAREAATLRNGTLTQLLDGIALERERAIDQFLAEEQRLRGVLTELRQTLAEGNELALSVGVLVERLGPRPPGNETTAAQREPSEPFDIDVYRSTLIEAGATIRDLNGLLDSTQQLLDSHGASELLPQLATAIDKAGDESRAVADHLFLRSLLLIVIALTLYVIARLVHARLAVRIVRGSP